MHPRLSHKRSHRIYEKNPVFLQNLLVSIYGYYLHYQRYGSTTDDFVKLLKSLECASKSQIEALETEALHQIIDHAYQTVPYYRALFNEHDLKPDDIQDKTDLNKIPILEKEVIRKHPEQFLSQTSNPKGLHVAYTSGTTGTPLRLYQSVDLIRRQYACHTILREWAGVSLKVRRATFGGRMVVAAERSKPPFWRYNAAENQMLFSSYHMNESNLYHYVEALLKFQPVEIIGYPSSIYSIANDVKKRGITGLRPKVVLTNSETLLSWQRSFIEQAFGCVVFDWYSSEEFSCFIGQCEQGGYHIFPLVGIVELLPIPEQDKNGYAEGELVCTSLLNKDMPLLRYKMGDGGRWSQDGCPCGRSWPVLDCIAGRIDDYVTRADGTQIGRLDHVFKGVTGVKEAQIHQISFDRVEVNLVVDDQYNSAIENKVKLNLTERIGEGFRISFNYQSSIPRTARGKFRAVISDVSPN